MLYKDLDYRLGSPMSKDGLNPTLTGATLPKGKLGFNLQTGLNQYATYSGQLLPDGAFSVVVWAKLKATHVVGTDRAGSITGNVTGTRGLMVSYSAGLGESRLSMGASNYRNFSYLSDKNWHCYISTIPGSAQTDINNSQLFVDTVLQGVTLTVATGAQDARSGFIYVGGGNNASGGCHISRIKVYDTVLTTDEQRREYEEYVLAKKMGIQTYQTDKFSWEKPTEYVETGKVAHYVFSPKTVSNGTLVDISGNGNNGTISGALLTKNGMKFDGVNDYVFISSSNLIDVTNPFTFCYRGKSSNLNGVIFNSLNTNNKFSIIYATNQVKAAISDGTTKGIASINVIDTNIHDLVYIWNGTIGYLYVDGILANGTDSIGFSGSNGTRIYSTPASSSYIAGEIQDIKIYNTSKDATFAQNYHNSFVKPILVERWKNNAVSDTI